MGPSDLSQRGGGEGGGGSRSTDGGWRREKFAKQFPFFRDCLPGQLLQVRLHNWMAYEGPVEINFRAGVNLVRPLTASRLCATTRSIRACQPYMPLRICSANVYRLTLDVYAELPLARSHVAMLCLIVLYEMLSYSGR